MFTPKFQINWPFVFTPVPKDSEDLTKGNEFRLEAVFNIPVTSTSFKEMRDAAEAAMIKKFGANQADWPANWHNPFRDQKDKFADKTKTPPAYYTPGNVFMNLKQSADSGRVPQIVDEDLQDVTIAERHRVYSGLWAIADVDAYAYDKKGQRGVSFGLNHIQILPSIKHKPWDNRTNAREVFKKIEKTGEGAGTAGKPLASAFG